MYCTVTKEEWVGNTKHAYKADPRLRVRGVPTVLLVKRAEGGTQKWEVVNRIEKDADFQNKELLQLVARHEI